MNAVPRQLNFVSQLGYYSLVPESAENLSLLQRMPHFDSNNPYYFAILHYLNPGRFGGAAFFKYKPTSFGRISNERVNKYMQVSSDFFKSRGEPEKKYITESSELYDLCDRVEYRQNRLVIYPANLLHSGIINPLTDVSADPRSGRLTANIFVEFK